MKNVDILGTPGDCHPGQHTRSHTEDAGDEHFTGDEPFIDWPDIDWPEIEEDSGKIVPNSRPNVRAFLTGLGVELWLDLFANRIRVEGVKGYEYLDDRVLHLLWGAANELGFRPSLTFMKQALMSIGVCKGRHPLQERLKRLKWDGVPRAERLLINYAHAEDIPLNRAIGKLLLAAMVRRIVQPGCKYDYMVILQGSQGCGKSMFCRELAGGPDFFVESLTLAASVKEVMERTSGKWVAEIAELSGLTGKDIERQKALITTAVDCSRLAYGYSAKSVPRQFVLIGTTNEEVFLRDSTGNRRYLPVRVSNIDIAALKRDREQLLAEAVEIERTYGPLVMPPELAVELLQCQEEFTLVDYGLERLNDYISDKLSVNPHYMFEKDALFAVMGVTTPKSKDGKVLAHVTRHFGLREAKRTINGRRVRVFVGQETAETASERR